MPELAIVSAYGARECRGQRPRVVAGRPSAERSRDFTASTLAVEVDV